jgi:hypothetical protein
LPNFEKEENFAIFPFFSENFGIYQVFKNQKINKIPSTFRL